MEAILHADVLIIGGTSLVVYPAAGLIDYYRGNKLVLVNKKECNIPGCRGGSCDQRTDRRGIRGPGLGKSACNPFAKHAIIRSLTVDKTPKPHKR